MPTEIRPAHLDDLPALTELYNHYVVHTPVTFDIEPFSVDQRRAWFDAFAPDTNHQLFVADEGGKAVAFAYSGRFRPKSAYQTTVETTVYCAPDATGRGLGRELYSTLFKALEGRDLHRAVAGITLPNPASVRLHESFGYERIGTFSHVGYKDGRYWDVGWFEKPLS